MLPLTLEIELKASIVQRKFEKRVPLAFAKIPSK
jgi:hypothetical protein